jgi:PIN domain nuclease of toxin-antitoxin system
VNLLLDTHVVLWALGDPKRLSAAAREHLVNSANRLHVSAASAWEIALEVSLGKLRLPGSVADWLLPAVEDLGAQWCPVTQTHAALVESLPPHHRDPFDRILIAQAANEGWTMVSADEAFAAYDVPLLRA